MTETISMPIESRPRRLHLEWVLPVLFRPRQAFAQIAAQTGSVWLTPLLILTVTTLIAVLVAGPIKKQIALNTPPELPPNFEFYTPEDQAEFMQAMTATQSNAFFYVLPALTGVAGIWIGWLIVGGLVHLALTVLGGRGATGSAMNLVAWASLPFALRDIVRAVYTLTTDRLISHPGLSGFAPAGEEGFSLYLVGLLALVDLYVIWHILLLSVGVQVAGGLRWRRALVGMLVVVLVVIAVQALFSYFGAQLSSLTIIRQF